MIDANPYSAPPEEESSPSARRRQELAVLQFYWAHREASPTVSEFSQRYAKIWLFRLLMTGLIVVFAFVSPELWFIAAFLGGLVAGRTLNDVTTIRRSITFWPLTQKITSWPEVERLLENQAD